MICESCKGETDKIYCSNCGDFLPDYLAFDKEEVALMRDHLVGEWIQRDHPYYYKAKEMFNKMHVFLEAQGIRRFGEKK